VVFTSSSAAILNTKQHPEVYDETYWAPMTWEEALQPENAYKASKVHEHPCCHHNYLSFT
jgi:nucleoside-diphosphate-sugar epimerase